MLATPCQHVQHAHIVAVRGEDCDPLNILGEVAGRHLAADSFDVLSMIEKLYGVQRPDVNAHAAHGEFWHTVIGMFTHHLRLNTKNVFHFNLATKK